MPAIPAPCAAPSSHLFNWILQHNTLLPQRRVAALPFSCLLQAVYEAVMVHRTLGDMSTLTEEEKGFATVQDWVAGEPRAAGAGFTRVTMTSLKEEVLSQLLEPDAGPRLCRVSRPWRRHTRHPPPPGRSSNLLSKVLGSADQVAEAPGATHCPTPACTPCRSSRISTTTTCTGSRGTGNPPPRPPAPPSSSGSWSGRAPFGKNLWQR